MILIHSIAEKNENLNFDYSYEILAIRYLQNENNSVPPALLHIYTTISLLTK